MDESELEKDRAELFTASAVSRLMLALTQLDRPQIAAQLLEGADSLANAAIVLCKRNQIGTWE